METAARMVHHESWIRAAWGALMDWVWHNKTHRVLIYIALVATISLLVQLTDFTLVGQ